MSILPGESMSSLGGAGQLGQFGQSVVAGYARQQEYLNALHKARLDALSLSASPMMMCSNHPPNLNIKPGQVMHVQKTATEVTIQQQQMSKSMATDMAVRSQQIKHLLNNLLPEQCREHVYKVDHEHSLVDDCEIVKWTFFNDLSVRLKVAANLVLDGGGDDIEPIIEDYELWQADALMKCEAGEDVWPRPKATGGNASQGPSAQQMQQMQQLQGLAQQGSGMMNQQALGNQLSNALGLGSLFK